MIQFVKPDSNIDFLGGRGKAFAVSTVLVLASVALLAIKGFNFGIDFKGGSSAIVAFKKGSVTDRAAISGSVGEMLKGLQVTDSQVSVQDFGAGSGDTLNGEAVDRFLIYTEVTSLVGDAQRTKIEARLKEKFGAETRVASSADAGDRFYVTFPAEADITTRIGEIKALLGEPGIGFSRVTVTSDLERQVEVEFLREVDLERADAAKAEVADGGQQEAAGLSASDLAQRRADAVANKSDKRFTVEVAAMQAALDEQLQKSFAGTFLAVESSATVSPSVGADLFNDGMLAILYSLIGILIYVTLRFDFRFAPGGVVALAHDAIITMGFLAAFDLKFSLPIIAALLTIVGYSINDTIIVYDRVRENLAAMKGKSLIEIINRSVNETMSRTILTSGTTLLSVIAILVFGGATIRDFGLALFVGIAVGTYSSIYIASPFVLYLDNFFKAREAEKKEAEDKLKRAGVPGKKAGTAEAAKLSLSKGA
jgi:preprotein translocase subunit SecF